MHSVVHRGHVWYHYVLTGPFNHVRITITPVKKLELPAAQISRIATTDVFVFVHRCVHTLFVLTVCPFLLQPTKNLAGAASPRPGAVLLYNDSSSSFFSPMPSDSNSE